MVPIAIYYLDKYDIPTCLGWTTNIDSKSWLGFLANYSAGIISAVISAVILVIVTILQIKKNNEDNIKRDKENLRVQNMPILKYTINTDNRGKKESDELIIKSADNNHIYSLNISIKNIGLNNIKSIKVDFKSPLIDKSIYRVLGNSSLEVLEKGEEIIISKFISLKSSKEPYDIEIIVYNEYLISINDILSNLNFEAAHNEFEESIKLLGKYIGLFSERPEKEYNNGGPDNLWGMGDNLYYVIECKNESNSVKISKRDCGQLHNSKSWFYKEYGKKYKCIPIIIHINNKFEDNASPEDDFKIIDKEHLNLLKENVNKFAISLCSDVSNIEDIKKLEALLKNYNLTKDNFINYYTIKV